MTEDCGTGEAISNKKKKPTEREAMRTEYRKKAPKGT